MTNQDTTPEVLLGRFTDAMVVQLLDGDPSTGVADVSVVHEAVVTVTADRITADGPHDWTWLVSDLVQLHHGSTSTWTIFVVPAVAEFGVAVQPDDLEAFRSAVDTVLNPEPVVDVTDEPRAEGEPPAEEPRPVVEVEPAVIAFDPSGGEESVIDLTPPASTLQTSEPMVVVDVAPDPVPASPPPPPPPTGPVPVAAEPAPSGPASSGRRRGRGQATSLDQIGEAGPLAGLDAHEISAWFGTHNVLDRVSLSMPAGRVTALIGPSGCGKSTFLRILNRMHEMIPSAAMAGRVMLDGEDIYDPQRKLTDARRQIGMVFQKPNPFPAMSIYDNVIASFQLTGIKATQELKDETVESCLRRAGLWDEVKDRLRQPGGGLSGGQQQRLCIARALAVRPRVLLMDEPCSALDPTSTRRIEETIVELVREVTIVIVTHNMQQAARVSDQCAFFLASHGTPGVIIEHGDTDAMFSSPQDERTYDYVNGRFG